MVMVMMMMLVLVTEISVWFPTLVLINGFSSVLLPALD
jgi:hypothetical protein